MCKLLRRLFWIALLAGAGYALYTKLQGRRDESSAAPQSWPPLDDSGATAATAATSENPSPSAAAASVADTGPDQRWVPPVDGACPDGYPIKGNDDSGIYHVPGGRFYDRTVPERCYADEADAEADGYRRSKA